MSLTGEVRPVPGLEKRSRACRELGFDSLIGPAAAEGLPSEGAAYTGVGLVKEAIKAVFGTGRTGPQ